MKIGVTGPSNIRYLDDIDLEAEDIISDLARVVAQEGHEILITPEKGSASEFFAQKYKEYGGKKICEVVPLDDEEFGYGWVNLDLGKHINCGTWRNQPQKFNEESDILLCIGYAAEFLAEIAYAKQFRPNKVYVIRELVSRELPKEINRNIDLEYISSSQIRQELKSLAA